VEIVVTEKKKPQNQTTKLPQKNQSRRMPAPSAFLNGFHLKKNQTFGPDIQIRKASAGHIVVERYAKYEFPIQLVVSSKLSKANILEEWNHFIKGSKIIYSQYGNPYKCTIRDSEVHAVSSVASNTFVISCLGIGVRVK
jgi:hypothetical protein